MNFQVKSLPFVLWVLSERIFIYFGSKTNSKKMNYNILESFVIHFEKQIAQKIPGLHLKEYFISLTSRKLKFIINQDYIKNDTYWSFQADNV